MTAAVVERRLKDLVRVFTRDTLTKYKSKVFLLSIVPPMYPCIYLHDDVDQSTAK